METHDTCCTIVPYFTVKDGELSNFEKLSEQAIAITANEPKCLYYGWCVNGDLWHCREGYQDAEGVLAHLENVNATLQEILKISDLSRLEIHGPEAELEKLRGPLAALKPQFFALKYGFRR